MDIPPLPVAYYENFLESIAQIVSKLLADKEAEAMLKSLQSLEENVRRLSSKSLSKLGIEFTTLDNSRSEKMLGTKLCKHKGTTCTQNSFRAFTKAFGVAFIVKYLVGLSQAILSGDLLKRPILLKRLAGWDTISFALFLGTFLSSYKAILCAMRRVRKSSDPASDRLNGFVAGSVAGLALALDRNAHRRQSIMLLMSARTLQVVSGWLMKQWDLHRKQESHSDLLKLKNALDRKGFMPGESRGLVVEETWQDHLARFARRWAGVGLMMAASAQLTYSFMVEPHTLPNSFIELALVHSGGRGDLGVMAGPFNKAGAQMIRRLAGEDTSLPIGASSRGFIMENVSPNIAPVIPRMAHHASIGCALQHPLNDNCLKSKLRLFLKEFPRAFWLFVPLNLVVVLVSRFGLLTKEPLSVLQRLVKSSLRSALFLSLYMTAAFGVPCALRRIFRTEGRWIYAVSGLAAGSMSMVEAKGRQLELGLYFLPRAMEALWQTMASRGYVGRVPFGEVVLFMGSMGTLMTLYQNDKSVVGSTYLGTMFRFFGEN
ncbi:hypothetical protein CLU79DRAFT_731467 [Phycomyces nitens]|nr:hypothetical protein CLU79DRAFT_731467 [Phycomyces nitens]